jgi:hypothetical protein
VTALCVRIAVRGSRYAAESLLPAIMQGRAAPSLAKAANAVVDGPALDATTATAGGGGGVV